MSISGFVELNEHNGIVQAEYNDYKYIYKFEKDTLTYILTNKDDVYVEPEPIPEPEPEQYVPTDEEIAEQERRQNIDNIKSQIRILQNQLNETDYIFVKTYEASLIGETIDEYNFSAIHAGRQLLRNKINALKEELEIL